VSLKSMLPVALIAPVPEPSFRPIVQVPLPPLLDIAGLRRPRCRGPVHLAPWMCWI
jgi:hypothetical protein